MTKFQTPYADLLPPLSTEEFEALRADIEANGIRDKVVFDEDGNVLDGHNRLKIDPDAPRVVIKGLTAGEKEAYVYRSNNVRRNLSPMQKDELRKRMKASCIRLRDEDAKRWTQPKLALAFGVSQPTISVWLAENIKSINADTPNTPVLHSGQKISTKKHPEIIAAVESGKTQSQVAADYKVSQGLVSTIVKKGKQKLAETKEREKARAELKATDAFTVTIEQDHVKCASVITDPPYGILDEPWEPDVLEEFTEDWAERWNDCGADTFAIFWSQRYLWDGRSWFDRILTNYEFQQLLVWVYRNNKSPQSRKGFKQTWEPVFFYRRKNSTFQIEPGAGEWGADLHDLDTHEAAVPQSNFNDAERKLHPAQKPVSVMRWLINALSAPGDLIADPFCGSGTTGVAALQLGRKFHGIEMDAEFRKLSEERIAAYGIR